MRRIMITIGALLLALALLGCSSPEDDAHNRVTMMLDGWQRGDMEEAVCRWYNGARQLQLDHLKHAQDEFDIWRREKMMYKEIDAWAIKDVKGGPGTAVIVSVDIDGQGYQMRVPHEQPIEWAQ